MTAENENKSTTSASGLSQSKTRLRLIDYYWVVICKNHRVHHKGNTSYEHHIRLGEHQSL